MLCDKIKEFGLELQQTDRSMDKSSMQNYWQTEMEKFEEPTLAQQFEFALAKHEQPLVTPKTFKKQFNFALDVQDDDKYFDQEEEVNDYTRGEQFEKFLAEEEESMSIKCKEQKEKIQGLEFKISTLTDD